MGEIKYKFSNDSVNVEMLQAMIKQFASQFKAVRDFSYTWTQWKNWEKYPPVVAIHGHDIVGFQAVTLSERTGYINFYYNAVALEFRNKGIAKAMLDFYLMAKVGKYYRIKIRTSIEQGGSPGFNFWSGLGLKPFAIDDSKKNHPEHIWNEDISAVTRVSQIPTWMMTRELHNPIPDKDLKIANEKGYKIL